MPQTYFKNFQQLNYGSANTLAIDLTERIVIQRGTQWNPYIFYPLDISDGIRPDVIAYTTWGDPYASWVLYLSNKIVDPYYDYFLTQEQFSQYIVGKYDSLQAATEKILYYQTDWTDDTPISIVGYEALSANEKKYYTANYSNTPFIQNYVRKHEELRVSTNYILNLTISGNTADFIADEVVHISYVPGSNGSARVITGNSTNLFIQHGLYDAFPYPDNPNTSIVIGGSSYIAGATSGANATITAYSFVTRNLASDEEIYWSPVYAYDYEVAKNQGNRIVNVMQPKYVPAFVNLTANLLSQVVS